MFVATVDQKCFSPEVPESTVSVDWHSIFYPSNLELGTFLVTSSAVGVKSARVPKRLRDSERV